MPALPRLLLTRLRACFIFSDSHISSMLILIGAGLLSDCFATTGSVPSRSLDTASPVSNPGKAGVNGIFCCFPAIRFKDYLPRSLPLGEGNRLGLHLTTNTPAADFY